MRHSFKLYFKYILSLTLVICLAAPSAHASLTEKLSIRSAEAAFQTLLIILLTSGLEAVRERIYQSHLTRDQRFTVPLRDTNPTDAKVIYQTAQETLNDPHIWTGLTLSLGATALVGEPATRLLQNLSKSQILRQEMSQMLSSAIVSIAGTAGWEWGQELWEEARRNLKDPEEFQKTKKMGPLFTAFVLPGSFDQLEQRVSAHMMQNMWRILITDPSLRQRFLYNTWRKRFATGDFATQLFFIVSSIALVRRALPAQATLLTAALSVVAGTMSLYFPEDLKDMLTRTITRGRSLAASYEFSSCKSTLANLMNTNENDLRLQSYRLRDALKKCSQSRTELVDIQLEGIHRQFENLARLLTDRGTAVEANNRGILGQIDERIEEARQLVFSATETIRGLYGEDIEYLSRLRQTAVNFRLVNILDCEIQNHRRLLPALNVVLKTLEPNLNSPAFGGIDNVWLDRLFENGVSEDEILEQLGTPSSAVCESGGSTAAARLRGF